MLLLFINFILEKQKNGRQHKNLQKLRNDSKTERKGLENSKK